MVRGGAESGRVSRRVSRRVSWVPVDVRRNVEAIERGLKSLDFAVDDREHPPCARRYG